MFVSYDCQTFISTGNYYKVAAWVLNICNFYFGEKHNIANKLNRQGSERKNKLILGIFRI
jgi:hypothetical protein